jgi:serine/threonine protein kinase
LERKYFSEEDAKPLFRQIASAVNHLHNMDIIHRDIKPENILVLNEKDEATGLPVAKLLDFGLSKHAGLGSAARTFVGTPCYQAPEVEFTGKGLGGTYGPAADCWSLGAVLYVMLVARFPEFDHNVGYQGRKVLRLPDALWSNISLEAKSLIQGLMCYETDVRLTAADALRHDWLGDFRILDEEAGFSYTANTTSSRYPPSRDTNQIPPSIPAPRGGGTRGNDVMDMVLSDRYSKDVRKQAEQSSGASSSSSRQTYRMQSGFNLPPAYSHHQQGHNTSGYTMDDMPPAPPHSNLSSDMEIATLGHHNPVLAADHLPLAPLLHLQRQAQQH